MKKYIFDTIFICDEARNGQKCEIVATMSECKKDARFDLVSVKFADGYITECYRSELK